MSPYSLSRASALDAAHEASAMICGISGFFWKSASAAFTRPSMSASCSGTNRLDRSWTMSVANTRPRTFRVNVTGV